MADVPSTLYSWSATASSNSPNDNTTIGSGLADNLQALQAVVRGDIASVGANIASSANPDVGAVQGLYHTVTGNNSIAGLGSTATAGIWKILEFAGTPPLIHSTALQLPGNATIQAAAGDVGIFVCQATSQWRMISYVRESLPPNASASSDVAGVIELATNAETLTGTDTTRAVTPSALASVLGMAKLESGSFSSTSVGDVTMTAYTAFAHKLLVIDALPVSDGVTLLMQVSTDGGTSYDSTASNYQYAFHSLDDNANSTVIAAASGAGATSIYLSLATTIGNGATEGIAARVFMTNTTSTAKWPRFVFDSESISADATPRVRTVRGAGSRVAAQDTDGVRFSFSSGNISSATYTLYGYN